MYLYTLCKEKCLYEWGTESEEKFIHIFKSNFKALECERAKSLGPGGVVGGQ